MCTDLPMPQRWLIMFIFMYFVRNDGKKLRMPCVFGMGDITNYDLKLVQVMALCRQGSSHYPSLNELTHWGRVTHICVSKLTIIGLDNGLAPERRQTIIWSNDGILLMGPLGTNFSEILIGIQIFSFKKMHLKMSSAKWRPFCLGLNVLTSVSPYQHHMDPLFNSGSW